MRELTPASFADDVAALIGWPLGDERLAVAVSGGPDSLALLALAHAAFGARVLALSVDHGLRPGSRGEAEQVAGICGRAGIDHALLVWDGPKPTANLQAEAREARYRLMAEACTARDIRWLATAHHADDQAETLLMRLSRGAGVGGLAGIRARLEMGGISVLRPLLRWRKAELARVVPDWPVADDPTNRDPRHDRTHARVLLAEAPWLDAGRLANATAHLADAEAALTWAADAAWRSRVAEGPPLSIDAEGLPRELQRRLLVRALGPDTDGPSLARLHDALRAGRTATLAGIRARGGATWRFDPAPPRRG